MRGCAFGKGFDLKVSFFFGIIQKGLMLEEVGINITVIQGNVGRVPVGKFHQFHVQALLFGLDCCHL